MSLKSDLHERMTALASDGVDIIFVKERYLLDMISKLKLTNVKKPIQIVLVGSLDDLKALSHVDMRALGWVREEKVKKEK